MSNKEIGAALITGAPSGIGLVMAKALKQAGYHVFGTSRRAMTTTVHLAANTFSHIAILLSAVYAPQNQPDHPSVWLVDEQAATVKSVPVQVGETLDGERIAVKGLAAGQLRVSAGVQRLAEDRLSACRKNKACL